MVYAPFKHSSLQLSSPSPTRDGYLHNLQFLLEELQPFVGGGKEKRKGQEHRLCGLDPTSIFHPEFWAGDQVFLPPCGSRPGVRRGPFLLEVAPGSLNLASTLAFRSLLPAPHTRTFYDDNWKGKKGSSFVYSAINI